MVPAAAVNSGEERAGIVDVKSELTESDRDERAKEPGCSASRTR
jgi:hypothetical protein